MSKGFINHLSQTRPQTTIPVVGDGATVTAWSDRYAGTVVSFDGKYCSVQCDKATRIDKNGMSDAQEYAYEADPTGYIYTFRQDANGVWRAVYKNENGRMVYSGKRGDGYGLMIGVRDRYYDFSF